MNYEVFKLLSWERIIEVLFLIRHQVLKTTPEKKDLKIPTAPLEWTSQTSNIFIRAINVVNGYNCLS